MKQLIPLAGAIFLVVGCEEHKSNTDGSGKQTSPRSESSNVTDGKAEADKCVAEIKERVNGGLPSFLRIGEAKVELGPVVEKSRRGVMLLPVITNEDLYKPGGDKFGERQLLNLEKKKDNVETIKFLLIGSQIANGSWSWRDEIEEDVMIPRNVKPLSTYKDGIVRDSPEHLALIKEEAGRQQKAAEEAAALDAAARSEKIPPMVELLKLGTKAIGMVGSRYFHLEVTSADPSAATWIFEGHTMSKDGKTLYTDKGTLSIGYDQQQREIKVHEVTLGALTGLRGATASGKNGALHFKGQRVETTQGFSFK